MTTLILLRHGRSTANGAGVLAGRTAGVGLDETGHEQAQELIARLADVEVARLVSSPLQRCRETVTPLAAARGVEVTVDERITEVDYGDWTGRELAALAGETLWGTVQRHPSGMTFPGGEPMAAMAARASQAARDLARSDETRPVLLCSHGDVIKAILADALGMHLDLFQRIRIAPASLSVVHYGPTGAAVEYVNVPGRLPAGVASVPPTGDAAVGGETGQGAYRTPPEPVS